MQYGKMSYPKDRRNLNTYIKVHMDKGGIKL